MDAILRMDLHKRVHVVWLHLEFYRRLKARASRRVKCRDLYSAFLARFVVEDSLDARGAALAFPGAKPQSDHGLVALG